MRKKLFTFLLALTASIGMMWAETVEVKLYKSEFTSSGVTKEGVTLALSNGSMTSSDVVAMNGSFEFSTSLGKFTGITIETDANIMEIYEGAFTSAGWPTGDNLGKSAVWTGESETVLISCMVAGMDNITITCTIEPAQASTPSGDGDKLSGAFSVSSTKVVYFSKGNLQYDSDNQIWQFAANQWDYIGNAAGNNAITSDGIADNNGIVDMFCWVGASSSLEGIKQYGIIKSWSGYGSVAGEALKSDWGNTMGGDWRTLSKDEWIYLLTERTNAANLRTLGTVNGKAGLILMPDGWTASGVSLTVTTANYTTNDINITNWATLEGQGCAFLPAAGCCMSGLFDGVGGDGSYWSSTSRASGSTHAHRLHFRATDVDPTDFVERFTGMSVRLVSETTPSGGSTPEPSETTVTWDLSDMASMGTQGGYFKAKGITLMAYGVDNGMSGDGSYGGAFFGGPFVFTTSLGKFTKIEVTNSYLYDQPAFSGEGWTLDGTNAVWEGTPAALVSLVSNFGGITQIKFTIAPNTSTPANSCGDGLTWAVNDGVLTISYDGVGTGSMDNYDDPLSMPWFGQNITSVVLPEGLISIGQNAFAFINTFSQITLPSTLQYILMNAFSGCGLTSVTIPENVKGISASAFISSQSLATVTFEPTTPPRVGGNAFEYCNNDLIIQYPCESKALYYNDMQADIAYYHDKMYNCPAPTPANPVIKLNANFGGTYDWADTEAFTDNGDGTATLSNIALTAGYYYNFSVNVGDEWFSINHELTRENPSCVISNGEGIYYFQADVTGNYSFTWEYATNTLTIGYPHTYTAVGQNLAIFGNSWDPSITDNDLVLQEDGSYKWEKENVSFTGATTIQYRVCKDHAWDVAYPATSEQPASFEIPSLGDYKITITYNPVGNVISASAEKIAKPTIQLNGNFSGEWADTEAFEVSELPMHSYAKLTKLLEPGTYEFGVKVNGEWRANGSAYTRDNYSYIIEEGHTGNLTINVDVKGYYSFFWYYDDNRLAIDYSRVCGMYWKDVTAGNFEVTLGQEGEVTLPKVWATSMAFVSNIANGVDQVRLGSTDETVATIAYTLSQDGLGTLTFHNAGECDIYVVHDITDLYCYDSCAFHLTVLPAVAPTPTTEEVITNDDPENPSYHYSTFFHSTQNYKLTNDGTQAFIADLSGNDLVLTEIAKGTQVIPANTAVILRKSGSADPVVLTPTEENGVSVNPNDNSLEGVDAETAITSIDGLTTTNCYVLSGTNEYGVGFYRINSDNLKAHKAYVKYAGLQNNAPKRMRFVFNQEQVATGIDNANADIKAEKRIENGQVIIIRDGVRYNVMGAKIQ